MSTDHRKRDDQRWESREAGEQVEDPGIQVVSADGMESASVIAEIPGDDADYDASTHDQRWHEVLANFVDDPRGSVLAATDLVVNDVSAFVTVLDQRRKSMLNAPPGDHTTTTEDLRQTAATYRNISKQLTASIQALTTNHRRAPTRGDLETERREVIDERLDTAGGQ